MAKEGKKPIGKIVLGVIVVLVIVGAVGSMGGNSTDSSASDSAKPAEATQQAEEQKEPQEPYTIADEAEDTSNQFAYKLNVQYRAIERLRVGYESARSLYLGKA